MNINEFWKAILAQNADEIRTYFHPNAYVNWHCTNERFTVEEFIRANCEYPGNWDGVVERVIETGDTLVSVARVYPTDNTASFHVTSFIRLNNDLIDSMDEYWADDGDAPVWRQDMNIGAKIRE